MSEKEEKTVSTEGELEEDVVIADHISPIKVTVKLRESQYVSFNNWRCCVHGEDRLVPMQFVEWYCMSLQDDITSFKLSQVEEFVISGEILKQYR